MSGGCDTPPYPTPRGERGMGGSQWPRPGAQPDLRGPEPKRRLCAASPLLPVLPLLPPLPLSSVRESRRRVRHSSPALPAPPQAPRRTPACVLRENRRDGGVEIRLVCVRFESAIKLCCPLPPSSPPPPINIRLLGLGLRRGPPPLHDNHKEVLPRRSNNLPVLTPQPEEFQVVLQGEREGKGRGGEGKGGERGERAGMAQRARLGAST